MKFFLIVIFTLMSIFITSGCSNESGSSPAVKDINVTLSGRVVDGYLSDASVCLDLDINGQCSVVEPTTKTDTRGGFSFAVQNIKDGQLISFISSGGIDSATGRNYEGLLRSVTEVNANTFVYVTPLTDLIAKTFLNSKLKDSQSLKDSKETIARAYPIHSDYVDKSPVVYAGVFARVHEIQQLKNLLQVAIIDTKGIAQTVSQKINIQESIKSAIVKDIRNSVEPNVLNIISFIEEDSNVTIADNVKTFINEQQANIKVDLEHFVQNKDLNFANLNTYQVALENKADEAYAMFDDGNLKSFALNIDIFAKDDNATVPDDDDNTTVPDDDNTTVPDEEDDVIVPEYNTSKSFSGIVVDGYIKNAVVCIDYNYDDTCSASEPKTTTDLKGAYSFKDVKMLEDTLFPVISVGGEDTFTSKEFNAKLKTIVVANDLPSSSLAVISPMTDLIAFDFLKQSAKNKTTLVASQTSVATKFGFTKEQMLGDTTQDISVFMASLYIEHMKRLIETVVQNTDAKNVQTLRKTVKNAILTQILEDKYENLLVSRVIDAVEVNLNINISTLHRNFLLNALEDVKTVLDALSSSADVHTYTLPTIQKILEDGLIESYNDLVHTPLSMDVDFVVASDFDKELATYDKLACITSSLHTNTLVDSNTTVGRASDTKNGVTLESNTEEVTIYYPSLDSPANAIDLNNILVYDSNELFSFSFNEIWANKGNYFYIQTPDIDGNGYGCSKVELDSILAAEIDFAKVFRYSY